MELTPIRERTAADLDGCVRALAEVHAADAYPLVWPPDPARWLSPPGLVAAWVADSVDGPVGHVSVAVEDGVAMISRLFVAPVARGRRLGVRLLDHARRVGGATLLEVAELGSGAAIGLYERAGWRYESSATAAWSTPAGSPVTVRYYRAP